MSSVWNTAENLLLGSTTPSQEVPNSPSNNTSHQIKKISQESSGNRAIIGISEASSLSQKSDSASGPTENQPASGNWWKSGNEKCVSRARSSNLPAAVAESLARHKAHQHFIYKHKYKRLKKLAKQLVLENAAICDLVSEVQQQVLLASEERRFLLRKLSQYQAISDQSHLLLQPKSNTNIVQISSGITADGLESSKSSSSNTNNISKNSKHIKKKNEPSQASSSERSRSKKSRSSKPKRLCPPITLDSAGRPIFPIILGPLTIHSLGEIVSEREAYHNEHVIFPVGFCSSRIYASLIDPQQTALYTCKILENGHNPKFEVVCEEEEESVFTGDSPAECHSSILRSINSTLGMDLLSIKPDSIESNDRGLRFFGLSHPSVQNVLQACPGARKCSNYKWVRFEVCRSEAEVESVSQVEREASLCHESLLRNIRFARHHVSS